ncbi:MAG: hypothetical protein HYZ53_20915 [Planctomycetes bacterium]|nr:hypothetical protein [Planctomycetota bacterium]
MIEPKTEWTRGKDRGRAEGTPTAVQAATWEGVPHEGWGAMVHRARERMGVVLGEGLGLLFWGDYRVGKSSAAALLGQEARRWCRDPRDVDGDWWVSSARALWLPSWDLVAVRLGKKDIEERGGYCRGRNMWEEAREIDFLILDDVGMEGDADFAKESVHVVLRDRLDDLRATIMTTNMTLDKFAERYGEKCMGLVRSRCIDVHVTGAWGAAERARTRDLI